MSTRSLKSLDRAIAIAGSQAALARALGRKNQSYISEMRRRVARGAVVPAGICPAIERLTKGAVKRQHLNPTVAW